MKVSLVSAARLTDAQVEHWLQLQTSNVELQSPFFHPEYTRDAAAVFCNVEVAILEEDGEPVAYFPFQRTPRNVGVPVGGSLCDCQAIIARPGFTFDAAQLVRDCRLSGFRFTQLLASQQPFQRYHWLTCDSPSMDLSQGFEAYCQSRRKNRNSYISRVQQKTRKAIREIGSIRFEVDSTDPRAWPSLLDWKARQYRRIRTVNHLAGVGAIAFLERLLARRDNEFRGALSAMYMGDRLVAVHLGLRSRGILHTWFPTYNEEFGKQSPGMIYFIEQARAAADWGIQRIDLGGGNESFKSRLRSCGALVAEGAVGLGLVATSLRRSWLYARNWVQSSRFHEPARAAVRGMRGLFFYGRRNDSNAR